MKELVASPSDKTAGLLSHVEGQYALQVATGTLLDQAEEASRREFERQLTFQRVKDSARNAATRSEPAPPAAGVGALDAATKARLAKLERIEEQRRAQAARKRERKTPGAPDKP